MSKHYSVASSAVIKAPAETVYAILADYRDGHPNILPKQYFTSMEIEQGGIGAGTVVRVQMRLLGRTQTFRAAVTEPEPGRVMVETIMDSGGGVTTFAVNPANQARVSEVTITTNLKARAGVLGALERFIASAQLRRIYAQELRLLDAFAEERFRASTANAPMESYRVR
jgi:hypothetical protein